MSDFVGELEKLYKKIDSDSIYFLIKPSVKRIQEYRSFELPDVNTIWSFLFMVSYESKLEYECQIMEHRRFNLCRNIKKDILQREVQYWNNLLFNYKQACKEFVYWLKRVLKEKNAEELWNQLIELEIIGKTSLDTILSDSIHNYIE